MATEGTDNGGRVLGVAAWACTAWVLVAYFITSSGGSVGPFHWANFVGGLVIGAVSWKKGARQAALLEFAFALIGLNGVLHGW